MDPIRLTDTPIDAGPHGEGIVEYLPEDNALGFIPSQLLDPRHRLCVALDAYGIVPRPGTVILPEHKHPGTAQALAAAGLGTIGRRIPYGPFDVYGVEFTLTRDNPALAPLAGVFAIYDDLP